MNGGLTIWDILLFPIYLWIINVITLRLKPRLISSPSQEFYFKWAFRYRIFIIVVYSLLSSTIVAGDGYWFYFGESQQLVSKILANPNYLNTFFLNGTKLGEEFIEYSSAWDLLNDSNFVVVKFGVVFCALTFSNYLLVNLLIGYLAFLGSWQLFRFFHSLFPNMEKLLAVACMGIPTVIYWSSGIGKDGICFACIGFLTKALYDAFNAKRIFKNLVIFLICSWIIFSIKSYIILSYIPFLLLFNLIALINRTPNKIIKFGLKATIPISFALVAVLAFINSEEMLGQYSSDKILTNVTTTQGAFENQANTSDAGSYFKLGDFDGSWGGLVKLAPQAVIATFFRPFLWETRNMIMLLSSIESLFLFYFFIRILFKPHGLVAFFKSIISDPVIIYCLGFSLLFGMFVGISSNNFGSLVRYKIPCMPFFLISLLVIYQKTLDKSKST